MNKLSLKELCSKDIKLIALDMDGTCLDSKKNVSERTIKVLNKARKKNIAVLIATGRPPEGIYDYAKKMGILHENAYAICFNGSAIVRLSDMQYVYNKFAKGQDVKYVIDLAHKLSCQCHAYCKSKYLILEKKNLHSLGEAFHNKIPYEMVDFKYIDDNELFYKMLVVGFSDTLDKMRDILDNHILSKFTPMRSDLNSLEFIPDTCTKGTALIELCKILNIDIKDALAFGDADNDVDMLVKAGVGVAMGNALDAVKEKADFVTLTNDNDGVADLLEKILDAHN